MKNKTMPVVFTVIEYSENNNDYNRGINYDSFHEVNYYDTEEEVLSKLTDLEIDNENLDRDEPCKEVNLLLNGVNPTEYYFEPEAQEYGDKLTNLYFKIMNKIEEHKTERLEAHRIKKEEDEKRARERKIKYEKEQKEMEEKKRKELYLSLKKEFEEK